MKTINHSIVRSVCAILIGILLVMWSDAVPRYLVIAIGAMFLIPGLYAVVNYLFKGRNQHMAFPLVSIGSGLFGLWLMVMPDFFIGILMYVLGAVLAFAGISQIVDLVSARRWTQVAVGYYVVPVLLLIAGLVVLLNPFAVASVPFLILGISSIVYGVAELVNQIRFKRQYNEKPVMVEADIIDVEPIDDETK